MKNTAELIALAAFASFALLGAASSVPPEHADNVTTLAGSTAGYQDGTARAAEFVLPSALAYNAAGDLLILDTGANTVRVLSHGVVRTIAGTPSSNIWDAGGYLDGAALQARFNHPRGMAVGPDGAIYVADTLNQAIRRIRNGLVTTLAGGPGHWGSRDGTRSSAEFKAPVALTVDDKGNVYVADYGNGIREIRTDGAVITLPEIRSAKVVGLAFGKGSDGQALFVAAVDTGLIRVDLASRKTQIFSAASNGMLKMDTQGSVDPGVPQAVSALDNHIAAYTDVRTDTIRLVNFNYVRVLAGKATWDFDRFSGGYADGEGDSAQFNAPLGIAFARDHSLMIADAGNHRIRRVAGFDTRLYAMPDGTYFDSYAPRDGDVSIAWVGNSLSWTDNTWNESIASHVQQDLRHNGFKANVIPMTAPGASLDAVVTEIEGYFTTGIVQCVAIQLNTAFVTDYGRKSYKSVASDSKAFLDITSQLTALRAELEKQKVRVVAVIGPYGYEVSPTETMQLQELVPYPADVIHSDVVTVYKRLVQAVKSSGVPVYDAWPMFARVERTGGEPLFGTIDPHMTEVGRTLMAHAGAAAIEQYGLKR